MNEQNTKTRFETQEKLAAYTQGRLVTILSRLAFGHIEDAKFLTAQLTREMAAIRQQADMMPAQENPDRYDLASLPASSAFDE